MMRRNSTNIPSIARNLRRRAGMPNSNTQARTVLPPANQGNPFGPALAEEQLENGAVVEMVIVAVPTVLPVMLTGLVEPKVSVGVSMAPAGLALPVNPPLGVRVIVEKLPTVPPGAIVTADPEIVRPGGWMAVTTTGSEPLEVI